MVHDTDRYGRTVAEVYKRRGRNIGLGLVKKGYAEVYEEYAYQCDEDKLIKFERKAQRKGRGADPKVQRRSSERGRNRQPQRQARRRRQPSREPCQDILRWITSCGWDAVLPGRPHWRMRKADLLDGRGDSGAGIRPRGHPRWGRSPLSCVLSGSHR